MIKGYAQKAIEMMNEGPITADDLVIELGIESKNASCVLRDLFKRGRCVRGVFATSPQKRYIYAPDKSWIEPWC